MNSKIISLFKKYFFLPFTLALLVLCITIPSNIYGDGWEYLGMTISITNHLSPDLTADDIMIRHEVARDNNIDFPITQDYSGYFKDLNGNYYSYHFWFYSLISSIPYVLLKILGINTLKVFQVTNAVLYILLIWRILYGGSLNNRMRLWLALAALINPIILYIPWSHPEVFTFVFLFIGLLELLENKKLLACLFISLASLQNPAIAIIPVGIVMWELIITRKMSRQIIYLGLASCITFLPYIFYWIHFREFNLITASGFSSIKLISLDKVTSLFFDPNFGLVAYIPLLLFTMLWLILRRDKVAMIWACVLFALSVICATQLNWNSGMMYINRYSVWFIPIIIIATLHFIASLSKKAFAVYSILFAASTGMVTAYCVYDYNPGNYLKFSPVAKTILSISPSLYNPPHEVFAERTLGLENSYKEKLPITLWNIQGPRKSLVRDNVTGVVGYLNGERAINSDDNLFLANHYKGNDDIFTEDKVGVFLKGWYDLEKNESSRWRWIEQDSELQIYSAENKRNKLVIGINSFYRSRNCEIYLGNEKVFSGVIGTNHQLVESTVDLVAGFNMIKIVSLEESQAPKEIPNLKNGDSRKLSFVISSISFQQ